jgi:hypothetical protein
MRKVLVVAGGRKDYSDARRFGELVYVTYGSQDLRNIPRHLSDYQKLLITLDEPPYICISGYAGLNSLLQSVALELWENIDLLIWDAKTKRYTSVPLSKEMLKLPEELRHLAPKLGKK